MEIYSFSENYRFLSNFYVHPFIAADGKMYMTVEHFYQSAKTANIDEKERIRCAPTPGKAKRLGASVELIDGWDRIKVLVMLEGLKKKFAPDGLPGQMLIGTGPAMLVEGNRWHDNFWGDCFCDKCKDIPGANVLGCLLMSVRNDIQK